MLVASLRRFSLHVSFTSRLLYPHSAGEPTGLGFCSLYVFPTGFCRIYTPYLFCAPPTLLLDPTQLRVFSFFFVTFSPTQSSLLYVVYPRLSSLSVCFLGSPPPHYYLREFLRFLCQYFFLSFRLTILFASFAWVVISLTGYQTHMYLTNTYDAYTHTHVFVAHT